MVDLKKTLYASFWVTGIAYLLSLIWGKLFPNGFVTLQFSAIDLNVKQQILGGVDQTLAGKILGYFAGIVPIGEQLTAIVLMLLASFIIVYLGALISEKISIGKTETMRFGVGMGIASVIVGALVGSMAITINALGSAFSMLIYFVFIAMVYGFLKTKTGFGNLMPIP